MTWDEWITYDPDRVIERKPSFEEVIIAYAEEHGMPTFSVEGKGEHNPKRPKTKTPTPPPSPTWRNWKKTW